MYSDRRGTYKNHPEQNLPDKKPRTKPPGQKPPRTKKNHYKGICMYACTSENWEKDPRRVTYFWGVPRCVTKCDRGGGENWSKIA